MSTNAPQHRIKNHFLAVLIAAVAAVLVSVVVWLAVLAAAAAWLA